MEVSETREESLCQAFLFATLVSLGKNYGSGKEKNRSFCLKINLLLKIVLRVRRKKSLKHGDVWIVQSVGSSHF